MISCRFSLLLFLCSCALVPFYGCASAPYVKPPVAIAPSMPGVYHRVEKGQTLWGISKIYSADLDEIASVNRIQDKADIEVGQRIFIPNRQRPQKLPMGSSTDDFIWPLRGRVIALFGSTFGNMINKGLNIAPSGTPNVLAARSGRVIFYSDNFGSFGKTLIIDHGEGFSTVYARNAQVFVKPGDTVQRGGVIARAGSAGRDRSDYLHFEIRKGHLPQNPYFYLSH